MLRLWCVRASGTGVCLGCGGVRWGGFRGWGSCEVGWMAVGWLCRCPRGTRVQHRKQPTPTRYHPPRPALRSVRLGPANPTSRHARRARGRKPHAAPRNHQHTADLRNRTDLGTGYDRFRGGSGPISTRNTTDLDAGYDRSRRRGRLGGPKKRGTRQASTDRWTPPSLGRLSQVSYLVHKIETRGTFSCDPDQQPH